MRSRFQEVRNAELCDAKLRTAVPQMWKNTLNALSIVNFHL